MGTGTGPAFRPAAESSTRTHLDVVELELLMPAREVALLEREAHYQGRTVGELIRHLIRDYLREGPPPARTA